MTNDPKERHSHEYISFDDAPTNYNGKGQEERDWEEIRLTRRQKFPELEDDSEDCWGNWDEDENGLIEFGGEG